MSEDKIGAYICTGCGIGESLEADALVEAAMEENRASFAKPHPCLCGSEGVALISGDVESESLTKVCVAACSMTSCFAGPKQLSRSVDDWDQTLYVQNPWLDSVLYIVPVIPFAGALAGFGDFFVDGYHFWVKDAWDMKGTGYKHANIEWTDGYVGSLIDGGEFVKVIR